MWGHRELEDNIVTNDTAEPDAVESAPAAKSKLPLVVTLAMVLGAMLMAGVGAVVFHVQSSNALRAEVAVLKKELKEKDLAHEETKSQVEALSRQIELLKDNAIARSSNAKEQTPSDSNDSGVQPGGVAADAAPKGTSADGKPATAEAEPPPRTKKPKSDKPNCELVGKTKEEQEETLKRCVSLIDLPK